MHDIAAISIDSGYKKKQILYRTGSYLHFDTDGNWSWKGKNNTFFSFNRMDSRNDDGYDESMDKWKIGEGDGIVVAAMGMLIGWYEILLLFSQACFLSAGYGLWLMVIRKSGKNRAFPFIPFLFMAVLLFSFFGR